MRRHAALALGEIGGDARLAAAALERLSKDPEHLVRQAAKQALGKLRGQDAKAKN